MDPINTPVTRLVIFCSVVIVVNDNWGMTRCVAQCQEETSDVFILIRLQLVSKFDEENVLAVPI